MAAAAIPAAAWAVAGFALYLLFASSLEAGELWTGGVLALLVAGWSRVVAGRCEGRIALGRDHVAPWARSLAGLPAATVRTAAALVAAVAGRSSPPAITTAFVHGPADDPRERGRRATAVLAASLAPDSFVVRLPPHTDTVVVHRVGGAARPPDARWLG